ncbi:hypothetical protein ACE6H2_023051 [Prunus campanulata]
MLVEDVTKVIGGLVLRPNPATSLQVQQLIHAMETLNNLHLQRMQEMAQTIAQTMVQMMATQNAQINERFDPLLGRPQAHQGAEANFARPHINQFVRVGGWNNPGENANNPLLGNQAIN